MAIRYTTLKCNTIVQWFRFSSLQMICWYSISPLTKQNESTRVECYIFPFMACRQFNTTRGVFLLHFQGFNVDGYHASAEPRSHYLHLESRGCRLFLAARGNNSLSQPYDSHLLSERRVGHIVLKYPYICELIFVVSSLFLEALDMPYLHFP